MVAAVDGPATGVSGSALDAGLDAEADPDQAKGVEVNGTGKSDGDSLVDLSGGDASSELWARPKSPVGKDDKARESREARSDSGVCVRSGASAFTS